LPKNLLQAKAASDTQAASVLVREIQQMAKFTSKLLSLAVKERDFKLAARVIEQLEVQLEVKAWWLDEPKETRIERARAPVSSVCSQDGAVCAIG
jgi:hypothetical protein